MTGTLVIGYGNPLRGDDAAGRRVAEAVAAIAETDELDVSVVVAHQLTPELAEPASKGVSVVFVDAAVAGLPGAVACREVRRSVAPIGSFAHDFEPSGLLAMAERLYGRRPRAYLVTVGGLHFEEADSLSPPVQAAIPVAVAQVLNLIDPQRYLQV